MSQLCDDLPQLVDVVLDRLQPTHDFRLFHRPLLRLAFPAVEHTFGMRRLHACDPRRMTFGERMGFIQPKELQLESMDGPLRQGIANTLLLHLGRGLWGDLLFGTYLELRLPVDDISTDSDGRWAEISAFVIDEQWLDVCVLLEEALKLEETLASELNRAFERDAWGYRAVGQELVPIVDDDQLESLGDAMDDDEPWAEHMRAAAGLLFDRDGEPDTRNSVKESISAVEAVARRVIGDDNESGGSAIKRIQRLHPALRGALSTLYGYASDAGGVRHSLVDGKEPPGYDEALFMLMTCAATVNLLKTHLDDEPTPTTSG